MLKALNRLKGLWTTCHNILNNMTKANGTLIIMRYRALNGTWYRIAHFDDDWHFVYITREKIASCAVGKTKNGKKYIKYEGSFDIDENGTICIY